MSLIWGLKLTGFWVHYTKSDGTPFPVSTLKTTRSALNRWMTLNRCGERTIGLIVNLNSPYFFGSRQVFAARVCNKFEKSFVDINIH